MIAAVVALASALLAVTALLAFCVYKMVERGEDLADYRVRTATALELTKRLGEAVNENEDTIARLRKRVALGEKELNDVRKLLRSGDSAQPDVLDARLRGVTERLADIAAAGDGGNGEGEMPDGEAAGGDVSGASAAPG